MSMANLVATINVNGGPQLVATVLGQVRQELASAVRAAAAKETDGRVVARLFEIAGNLSQELASAEAQMAVKVPTVHRERVSLADRQKSAPTAPPAAKAGI